MASHRVSAAEPPKLLRAQRTAKVAPADPAASDDPASSSTAGATLQQCNSCDPCGQGALASRTVLNAQQESTQAVLEDRGVRGAFLRCGDVELPLAFADIQREGATVTVTVHAAVHPDCVHKGVPLPFSCDSADEAEVWEREMEQANERVNGRHWGVSKGFIHEQRERWAAEGERCKGMTVAEYFADIGLGEVYDETWSWCAGVLTGLQAKEEKTAEDEKEIEYYKRKVEKTELYDEMELTDYMNVLKHQDLVPAARKISYASFIAEQSDGPRGGSGRPEVGRASVFVSHVWKMLAKDFFEVCLAEMGEEDYAWIDLYLHNQYQGAVSTIGDENSMYWIDKFGELISGIGKVVAIVTDWQKPVMLTRIWCLFELNAAINMGAELRFVSTAAERKDLWFNLGDKFKELDKRVGNIEVRDCDAKRPHEIQDKAIFLAKLQGTEDEVNRKLRTQMRKWLADAAQDVIHRTDPERPPLDAAALAIEAEDIGTFGARKTRLLEACPRLPTLLVALYGALVAVTGFAYAMWDGSGVLMEELTEGQPRLKVVWGMLGVCFVLIGLGLWLFEHQTNRQLRRPPLCGSAVKHRRVVTRTVVTAVCLIGLVGCASLVAVSDELRLDSTKSWMGNLMPFWLFALLATLGVAAHTMVAVYIPLRLTAQAARNRANLAVRVGWLRLRYDASEAEHAFRTAQNELQHVVGRDDAELSCMAAPGLARSLTLLGRHEEVAQLRREVEAERSEESRGYCLTQGNVGPRKGDEWAQRRILLAARMAAAALAPDEEVLALLLQAGRTKLGQEYTFDADEYEMLAFLERMSSLSSESELYPTWKGLPPAMRAAAGNNPLSKWVRITHQGRALYHHLINGKLQLDCGEEGVSLQVEVGMDVWKETAFMSDAHWELEYAELGGVGCLPEEQVQKYVRLRKAELRKVKAKKVCKPVGQCGLVCCFCCCIFVLWGLVGLMTESSNAERTARENAIAPRCLAPRITNASVAVGAPRAVLDFSGGYGTDACEQWRLSCDTVISGNGLHLRFTQFDTESCCDEVSLYDDRSPSYDGSRASVRLPGGELSGSAVSPEYHVAAGGVMTVDFSSDSSIERDGFVAEYWCEPVPPLPAGMAEAYRVSNAPDADFDGWYHRLFVNCNDKPLYMMRWGFKLVLFQPTGSSSWVVGPSERIDDCANVGWISASADSCPASPADAGCAGQWWFSAPGGAGASWSSAPSLMVTAP